MSALAPTSAAGTTTMTPPATPTRPRPAPQPTLKKQPARIPLLQQPRVQRVMYPLLVGVVLIALWQGLVTAMELPPYLVPSPYLMMQTLVTDWVPLGMALGVTLKITVLSFVVATIAGVLISFLFVQSKLIETALRRTPPSTRSVGGPQNEPRTAKMPSIARSLARALADIARKPEGASDA